VAGGAPRGEPAVAGGADPAGRLVQEAVGPVPAVLVAEVGGAAAYGHRTFDRYQIHPGVERVAVREPLGEQGRLFEADHRSVLRKP
jgi:hypothetical protein